MEQNKDQGGAAVRGDVRSGCPCEPLGLDGAVCPDPKTGLPLCSSADCYRAKPVDAVRGEAVEMTEVDRERMPKRDAFIAWAKGLALDVTESKDAWGSRQFVHPHIESIWFGWFHAPSVAAPVSARAADAPSEPSELTDEQIEKIRAKVLLHDIDHNGKRSPDYEQKFARAIEAAVKSRAADALDSQPTGLPTFHATQVENIELALAQELDEAALSANDYVTVNREKLRGIAERILAAAKLELSSQPTDGGVRNG